MGEVYEAEDLELRDGYVQLASVAEGSGAGAGNVRLVRKSLGELAVIAAGMPCFAMGDGAEPGLESTAYFTATQSTYANGTAVAEVEVDIETGRVGILRLVLAHDCGRLINPMIVEGQVMGGVAHAVGNALFERLIYDDQAQPLATNFADYLLPLAADAPDGAVPVLVELSSMRPVYGSYQALVANSISPVFGSR